MMLPPEPKAAFQGQTHPRPQPFHPQMHTPPHLQNPDVAANISNAEALRDHILARFTDSVGHDCQLRVIEDGQPDEESRFDGHAIVLSRSPTLANMFETNRASSGGTPTEIQVRLSGKYLRSKILMDALKYLYGGPLLQLDHQRPGSAGGEHIPSNIDRMNSALQHIAIGAWLKVQAIALRGVDVTTGLLHWETISTALAFALDGGLNAAWNVDDGSEDRESVSSSENSPHAVP